eukprot:TRINITY_DN25950_c0_g1_i2.p1 TRINITY_DN25950_c0_g1~~TRINITY_DN25950_c0_g1_i2.p1  ORF type:complete len:150 (+),score=0.12 TRINITY_DN25950_c0_g1_i2:190-639(+)
MLRLGERTIEARRRDLELIGGGDRVIHVENAGHFAADGFAIFERDTRFAVDEQTQQCRTGLRSELQQHQLIAQIFDHRLKQLLQSISQQYSLQCVFSAFATKKAHKGPGPTANADKIGSGGRIRTYDLRVMSPTSCQTAPPRTRQTISI